MRLLLLAVLALAACATPAPVPPSSSSSSSPPPPPASVMVNVAGLFPAASSRTVGDARALSDGLLARMGVEFAAGVGEGNVDAWLSRRLLAWLVGHGSEVSIAPPSSSSSSSPSLPSSAAKPTALLQGVRFHQMNDDALVAVVAADGGGLVVRYWAGKGDSSICGGPLTLSLTYVQLEATLTDANNRWVASLAEVVAVNARSAVVEVEGDVCAALPQIWKDELAPSEGQLEAAAALALDEGFRAMVTAATPPPP